MRTLNQWFLFNLYGYFHIDICFFILFWSNLKTDANPQKNLSTIVLCISVRVQKYFAANCEFKMYHKLSTRHFHRLTIIIIIIISTSSFSM
jgi:hypothetical protein